MIKFRQAVERNVAKEQARIKQLEEAKNKATATAERLAQEKLALQKAAEEEAAKVAELKKQQESQLALIEQL